MKLPKYSLGMGDRFAREGVFQLEAILRAAEAGVNVAPVWNKSHREHLIIGTQPADVRAEADAASRARGYKDPYFVDNRLYPNVDFYSGLVLRAMGIPENMFPVMFAIGRLPGWISQWKESLSSLENKIHRPRQIYMGPAKRSYVPRGQRLQPYENESFNEEYLWPRFPDKDFEWNR